MPDKNKPAESLSRGQMEDVIRGGGSVLHGGRIITRTEDLPTAVQLAQSDEQRATARKELEQRRADLDHQLAQLDQATDRAATDEEVRRQQQSATGGFTADPDKGKPHKK